MSEVSQIHKTFAEFGGNLNNDETLVSSARSGCDAAFVELWRRHSSTVFRAVYRIVKNREDAEDISQETFLKAFAHLQGFNGASKFSTWLVRIGINTALEELRRRRSRPEASFNNMDGDEYEWQRDIPDETINIETQLMKSEMITRMNMAIDRLNPALRVVIEMHHQHDYSQIEIATRTNLSVAAVKSRLYRARRALCDSST